MVGLIILTIIRFPSHKLEPMIVLIISMIIGRIYIFCI